MAIATIKIDSKRLDKILSKYPVRAKKAIRTSLHQSALTVQNRAKINAPYLTGHLGRSITNEVRDLSARVGTDVIYARVREFNTKRLPQGYLRPALKRSRKKILKIFERNLNKLLKP